MADLLIENLAQLPDFLAFFGVGVVMVIVFVVIYSWTTQHNEIELIRKDSMAATVAFSGAIIGFALPLASAMIASVNIFELIIWGVVALIVQIVVYLLVRLPMPRISERITADKTAAGVWLGSASLVGGILNAAAMTP